MAVSGHWLDLTAIHTVNCFSRGLACRAGHLDPQRALDLGVQRGVAFTRLKDGFSVVGVGE